MFQYPKNWIKNEQLVDVQTYKNGLPIIRNAKKQGLNVSCSVGIPHLIYTDKELLDFNPNYKIQPPLRGAEDQKALRQGLLDGTIDMVTCLHQPINPELKDLDFVNSEPGSIGLEAAFKVLQNQFPLEKVISFLTRGKKRFGINCPIPGLKPFLNVCHVKYWASSTASVIENPNA